MTGRTSAADLVGPDDEFLFLATASVHVDAPPERVWEAIEGDHQHALLGRLSDRFVDRPVTEAFPDGYRCDTISRARFGRRRSFGSVVWLDPPYRSVEVQHGQRTDLRYELRVEREETGTLVTCTQSYRARTASMESGAAIGQLQQRADAVVRSRVEAIASLVAS